MSGYEAWTRLAILVLVAGAPLVFLWFLRDAVRILRGLGEGPAGPSSQVATRGADEELAGANVGERDGEAGTNRCSGGFN